MSLDPDQLAGTDIKYSIAKLICYWLANGQIDIKKTVTTSVKKCLVALYWSSFDPEHYIISINIFSSVIVLIVFLGINWNVPLV